jgi:hypothetical protein
MTINISLTQPDDINVALTDEGDINVTLVTPDPVSLTLSQAQGEVGIGMPIGGNTGEFVVKLSEDDYDFGFSSSTSPVVSVNTKTGAVVLNTDDISDSTRTNKCGWNYSSG